MAGAGDEKESENPFSFKSFLKRGDGPINEVTKTTSKSTSRKKKTATKKVSVSRESDVVIGKCSYPSFLLCWLLKSCLSQTSLDFTAQVPEKLPMMKILFPS